MIAGTSARMSASVALQSSLQNDISTLSNQISTGKRLTQASDDPAAAAQVDVLRRTEADDATYKDNASAAAATATRADSAMTSLSTALTEAQTLLTQSATGTDNADGRAAAAAQLRSIAQSITQLSQQKDSNGQPLFPEGPALAVPIADGVQVAPSVSRATLFTTTDAQGNITNIADLLSAAADAMGGATSATAATVAGPFLSAVQAASANVTAVHSDQGVRAAQIDARQDAIASDQVNLASRRSDLEDTDIAAAMSTIATKMTSLQAAQAVFAKISSRSLFEALG